MEWFRKLPIGSLAIALGAISTIGWIALNGKLPLIISVLAGSLIAFRATLGEE